MDCESVRSFRSNLENSYRQINLGLTVTGVCRLTGAGQRLCQIRVEGRHHEFAIRYAIGAARKGISADILFESSLLGFSLCRSNKSE